MSWLSNAAGAVSNGFNAATRTVSDAYQASSKAVGDFGHVAVQKATELGRDGLDLGRRGLDAASSDISHAAAVVKNGVASAGHAVEGATKAGWQEAKQLNSEYHIVDRTLGGLRVVGGSLEVAAGGTLVAAGAATSEFGIGLAGVAGGSVIVAHGLDQTQAGVHQIIDARPHDALTSQGLQAAGISKNTANTIDAGASIVFSLGGGAGAKGIMIAADRAAASTGTNVWRLDPFTRGQQIEQSLGHNLPSNFPVIDRFENGVATSIKSIDLTAPTYQNAATLNRTITGYVDKIANFQGRTWAGVTIRPQDITARGLDLAIPQNSANALQQSILNQAISHGASRSVTVNVLPIR